MTPQSEWDRCKPWLAKAVEFTNGACTIDDVEKAVAEGDLFFWPGKNAAMVTEICRSPRIAVCNIFLAGGDAGELIEDMLPAVEKWAIEQKCDRIAEVGRPGWERMLKPHGYKLGWVVLYKNLGVEYTNVAR